MITLSSNPARAQGFTLVELVITLVVLAIIAGLAIPSFRSLLVSQQVRNASFDLASALLYAREEAVKRNANVTVSAASDAADAWHGGWQIRDSNDNVLLRQKAYNDITISANAATVVFNQTGRVGSASAPRFELTTADASIVRCVKVDVSGRLNPIC